MPSYADLFKYDPGTLQQVKVKSQAEANALNAKGYQQVGYTPVAGGDGEYTMQTGREGDYHYVTVTSQAEANALNAKGAQQVSFSPSADGKTDGSYLMKVAGKDPSKVQSDVAALMMQEREQGVAAQKQQYADMLNLVNSLGGTAQAKLDRQYEQLGARVNQNLVSRGLSNGSVAINAQRAVNLDKAFATSALNESLRAQRLGVVGSQNISYPSLDQIGALALQIAQNPSGGYVAPTGYTPPGATPKQANPSVNSAIPGVQLPP